MAVVVQQVNTNEDGTRTEAFVPRGEHFVVEEGALVVLDGVDGSRLALFAAGTWLSAQQDN